MCVTSLAAGVMIGNYFGGVRVTIIMKMVRLEYMEKASDANGSKVEFGLI